MRVNARNIRRDARALLGTVRRLVCEHPVKRAEVMVAVAVLRREAARERLRSVPVTELKQVADGPFRSAPVHGAEFVTVADVLASTPEGLRLLRGIGPATAARLHGAAKRLAEAAGRAADRDIDLTRPELEPLLITLHWLVHVDLAHVEAAVERVPWLLRDARWWPVLPPYGRRRRAVAELADLVRRADVEPPEVTGEEARRDYEGRPDDYLAVLADVAGVAYGGEAAQGFLPGEAAARVAAQVLHETHLTVPLAGYQAFGARFAIARHRAILGDGMGLGRTLQAIAAMAHRRLDGVTHFLVACPTSVLPSWVRDVEACSSLSPHPLHGPGVVAAVKTWAATEGVGIVPLESLPGLRVPPDLYVGTFVLDEADRVKNPGTARARAVGEWVGRAGKTLFLTGLPMRERPECFRTLAGLLGAAARPEAAVLGSRAFRAAAAPVYLRREQRDVLKELPDIVRVDELVAFSRADRAAYRRAVGAGDFDGMRRAAYAVPKTSAKLRRLRRLVVEAAAEGLETVVLSGFPEVLGTVRDAVAVPTAAIAEPPAPGPAVAIICEPQPDRELEARAIGRLQGRDGPLLVHRLVAPGVDERAGGDPGRIIEDEQARWGVG
ncbi:SNF2 family N-terminal domain-containing protein [Actinomadura meyerae]|uniref:SNF2 family N-terminal domain-containing protein n=1 Tax=Actinomadura meyerae TaxID=240840 RepID=A0A239C7Q5_9ACTN|nr:SNF2 family N-terminal domain-containing protein [Actinomadura meyerae]